MYPDATFIVMIREVVDITKPYLGTWRVYRKFPSRDGTNDMSDQAVQTYARGVARKHTARVSVLFADSGGVWQSFVFNEKGEREV